MATKFNPLARHRSRRYALQALYQWQATQTPVLELEIQFESEYDLKRSDPDYFKKIVNGVISKSADIDHMFIKFLDRPIHDINPVELAILRLASFELKECIEIPYRVVINEALKLAKTFGAQDSYKFINGVLDKVANKIRFHETQQ